MATTKCAQLLNTKWIYPEKKWKLQFPNVCRRKYLWEENQNESYVCFLIATVNHIFIKKNHITQHFLTVFVCFHQEGCKGLFCICSDFPVPGLKRLHHNKYSAVGKAGLINMRWPGSVPTYPSENAAVAFNNL